MERYFRSTGAERVCKPRSSFPQMLDPTALQTGPPMRLTCPDTVMVRALNTYSA